LQDGRLADHADAGQRDRLLLRSGVPSSGPLGYVGPSDREAAEPRRRRDHRQGLRAGPQARGPRAVAPQGRRPRRHAQQVRALGRPAVTAPPADGTPRRVLFVTGRLAEPALRRTLAEMAPAFAYDVAVMKITVAALMTTPWIARFLAVPAGTDLVLIPGLCEGDTAAIADRAGVRVEKGPKDLRQIPEYFGRAAAARDYGAYGIEIVAEVNNAPRLAREALRREADHYRASGADVIDIGCTPGREFPGLADTVRELVDAGMRVSVDSLDAGEIRTAVVAGAELVLSVNRSNLDVARDFAGTPTRVVVIPDFGEGLETLEPSIAALESWGVSYLIDPVIEPIGFGFFASLERFAEVRRRYPAAQLFMGIGNITELTAADTTGVNALLIAICEDRDVITVFNDEIFVRGTDIHEIFAQLGVEEATHAFYLGRELMKARLALTLGKNYRQEGALEWGYLTPPDDRGPEHVRLTQRSKRSRERRQAKGGA